MLEWPRIEEVRPLGDYRLFVSYKNGESGEIDFSRILRNGFKGPYAPLKDKKFFQTVQCDEYGHHIFWPDDIDYDPFVLYAHVTGKTGQLKYD